MSKERASRIDTVKLNTNAGTRQETDRSYNFFVHPDKWVKIYMDKEFKYIERENRECVIIVFVPSRVC